MIKFIFCFDGFPYVFASVFSTPAFSTPAVYSCLFHSRIFSAPISTTSGNSGLRTLCKVRTQLRSNRASKSIRTYPATCKPTGEICIICSDV